MPTLEVPSGLIGVQHLDWNVRTFQFSTSQSIHVHRVARTAANSAATLHMELATQQVTPTAYGEEADGGVVIRQHSDFSASCRWTIQALAKRKQRTLYSRYFSVGGYDWRLLVYPAGDSQALPGYVSLYLQARFHVNDVLS